MTHRDITRLLAEANEGRPGALDEVMDLVYGELRAIAARRLAARRRGRGNAFELQPTELVNEAFLRLIRQRNRYDSRGQFFAVASQAMLRVLLDHERALRRGKRGGDWLRVTLSGVAEREGSETPSSTLADFAEALERLETLDRRCAEIAKLRLLWGLTDPEVARTLELSLRTVERDWQFARRWLSAELRFDRGPADRSASVQP